MRKGKKLEEFARVEILVYRTDGSLHAIMTIMELEGQDE